jgi:hypothetical protein
VGATVAFADSGHSMYLLIIYYDNSPTLRN